MSYTIEFLAHKIYFTRDNKADQWIRLLALSFKIVKGYQWTFWYDSLKSKFELMYNNLTELWEKMHLPSLKDNLL